MATDRGGKITDGGPGFVDRVMSAASFIVNGDASVFGGWFGPSIPLQPIAPPETAGRQFDYPVSTNLQSQPRANEPINFSQLRALADNYDLLRLAIETRKNQVAKMDWQIRAVEGKGGTDAKAAEITAFLQRPDKLNTFDQWLRALLEDLLVIDAPTVYYRYTRGGGPFAAELIDGATIFRLVDESGRTPIEGPAYQQILKGVKAVNYTREELLYMPQNVRTNRLYGYSPVEQVLMTVNIALRRQVNQLQYYTEGNVPDLIIGVPKEWQPNAVRSFQDYWNALITSDNQADRRKTRFVPEGMKVIDTKERTLKDAYDEWLARIICYAFSLSPQALVAQMNRATAETAAEEALMEGLAPIMKWIRSFMTQIITDLFKTDAYEFAWKDAKEIDPLQQAQVHEIQIRTGLRTRSEIRTDDLGLDPIDEESETAEPLQGPQIASLLQILEAVSTGALPKPSAITVLKVSFPEVSEDAIKEMVNPIEVKEPEPEPAPVPLAAPPQAPGAPANEAKTSTQTKPAAAPPKPTEKVEKARKVSVPSLDRPAAKKALKTFRATYKKWLRAQVNPLASQITSGMGKLAKEESAADIEAQVKAIMADLGFKNDTVIRKAAQDLMEALYSDAGYEAIQSIVKDATEADAMLSVVNEEATKYAAEQSARLVAEVEDATREFLRTDIQAAIEQGWSTSDLADALADNYAFSDERAETIARTELANANVQGSIAGWKETGQVEKKQWIAAQDEFCDDCAELDGMIDDIDGDFKGNGDPPLHPNCRCDVLPILSTPDEGEDNE